MRIRSALMCMLVILGASSIRLPHALAQPGELDTEGSNASGTFERGQTVSVVLSLTHPETWQQIQRIEVALLLRDRPLDQVLLDLSNLSVEVVGEDPAASFGEETSLRGSFVRLDAERMRVEAGDRMLEIRFPLRLLESPPPGARFFFRVEAAAVAATGYLPLAPPVARESTGFSWGTLGVAVAAALFIGGFVGNLFSSRRRPQRSPSIYAVVQRRMTEGRPRP